MVPFHTTQAHSSYLGTRTFGSLDGVRGLCILSVVWHHATPPVPGVFFQRGFLGVDMFFVLSGFLIVTLMLRERDRMGTIDLKKFYARRMLRIFPIYYLLIFGLLVLYVVTKPASLTATGYYQALPFLLTYTSNWVHIHANNMGIMWSLATEEQFYLCWPIIEKLLRPLGVAVVLAVVLIVNQLINFGAFDGVFAALYGKQPHLPILATTFTPIALGVLLAHALHARRTFSAWYRLVGHRGSSLIFGALLLALVVFSPADISGLARLLIQLAMTLLLGAVVVREDHWARPVLTFAPLASLGVISYGMYIYHMCAIHPVRVGFERLGGNLAGFSFFVVSLVVTVGVASLSYRFIEQPLLKLKARFASDGNKSPRGRRATSRFAEAVAG
jgi:peptidoglycan/LPS O-acetylase OafA/YrhL